MYPVPRYRHIVGYMSDVQAAGAAWVPEACTLPTAQVPLRVAEFDDLFARTLRHVQRLDAATLRLVLTGGATTEAVARELTERETRCCSFFDFTLDRRGEQVELEVRVPPEYAEVLDGLAARGANRVGSGPGVR